MEDYLRYQCEDFVADSYFRQWVKQPDDKSNLFWNTFLTKHPERAEIVQQAVVLVKKLSEATADLAAPGDEAQEAAIWNAVKEEVIATLRPAEAPFVIHRSASRYGWAVAASVAVVLSIGGWWAWRAYKPTPKHNQSVVAVLPTSSLVEQWNRTSKPQLVSLPDGSSIILQKGSRVSYQKLFLDSVRTVTLVGEAYFEVAKDARHPFVVRTNELFTKVLGTSFNVRAYTSDKNVIVTVRSGRVAVFAHKAGYQSQKLTPSQPDSVVLTRNQQLVFARQDAQSIQHRDIIHTANTPKGSLLNAATFRYNATPISEVFRELERVYGISITYDKDALESCHITTDLIDEPLTDKMNIICKSIEATYTMQANRFAVSGRGCR